MSDFELCDLIAAPIIAMNEAEAQNSARYVELLESYAFEAADASGLRSLSTLAFSYARAEADGTASLQSVEIPLIQFLPISGVAIDQAKLNYALKINPTSEKSSGKLKILGRLAETTESNSPLSGNINIELHLKQVDMPQGVLSLLETTQQAAHQKTISVESVAPVIEPEPDPDPVFDIPDDFIDFEVIDTSAKDVLAGQDYTYALRADFAEEIRGQDLDVLITLGSQPQGALEFEGEKDLSVRHGDEFKVHFLTSPKIAKYQARTKINMTLMVEAKSGDGDIKTQTQTITLPRRIVAQKISKDIS